MTTNKQTVTSYLEAFSKNDHETVLSCLTDDIVWEIPGFFKQSGKEAFAHDLEHNDFLEAPAVSLNRIIEDADVLVAEGTMLGKRKDGSLIDVAFSDIFTMKAGKIDHLIIYMADRSGVNFFEEVAGKWFAAFNAHDLEALLALYAEDAVHFSPKLKIRHPETEGLVRGQAALRQWWQDSFERLPTLRYQPTSLTANGQRVFMEYIRTVKSEPDMLIAEVLEISKGKITASRVYHG